MTSAERNIKFIFDDYRAKGLAPVLLPDGRPVSLELTQWVRNRADAEREQARVRAERIHLGVVQAAAE